MVAGDYSVEENLEFVYEVVNQTDKTIHLQLNFTKPEWISFELDSEWLEVTFWDPTFFFNDRGITIKSATVIDRRIPP